MYSEIKTRWLGRVRLSISAQIEFPPIDVDYIDITEVPITNPARLLPKESSHPFQVLESEEHVRH